MSMVPTGQQPIGWTRRLFTSTTMAVPWLVVRLWLGGAWILAGWEKISGSGEDNWWTHPNGLQGFIGAANLAWQNRAYTHGHPAVPFHWIVDVLNSMGGHAVLFGRIVIISEFAIGLGLVLGCLTGIAAAGGVVLNVVYVTTGSAGINGIFIIAGVLLVAAWRVAGSLGLDRIVLPAAAAWWRRRLERTAAPRPGAEPTPTAELHDIV